jgi:hypothetical protein
MNPLSERIVSFWLRPLERTDDAILTRRSGTVKACQAELRYTRNLMSRRVAALVVALAIVGAPVGAIVCQLNCASPDTTAAEGHAHQHSCPMPSPDSAAGLKAVPHACGHQPGEALDQALQLLTIPVLVEPQGALLPRVDDRDVTPGVADIQYSPPRPLALTSPLRV